MKRKNKTQRAAPRPLTEEELIEAFDAIVPKLYAALATERAQSWLDEQAELAYRTGARKPS
ncbi:MAG: hypothetical protein WCA12_09545 [Burkholderiales bacterium]